MTDADGSCAARRHHLSPRRRRRTLPSPSDVSACALDHYRAALPPNRGKPRDGREWTVYAAVVAARHRRGAAALSSSSPSPSSGAGGDGGVGDEGGEGKAEERGEVEDLWVVSCATGSKCAPARAVAEDLLLPCLPRPPPSDRSPPSREGASARKDGEEGVPRRDEVLGMVLRDSHAEVLARRGLVRALWSEVEDGLRGALESGGDGEDDGSGRDGDICRGGGGRRLLRAVRPARPPPSDGGGGRAASSPGAAARFELRPDVSLHLYASDSPCGDASIYPLRREYAPAEDDERARKRPRSPRAEGGEGEGGGGDGTRGDGGDSERRRGEGADGKDGGGGLGAGGGVDREGGGGAADGLNFTGAKIVVRPSSAEDDDDGTCPPDAPLGERYRLSSAASSSMAAEAVAAREPAAQRLGALRLKSGRSDLPDRLRCPSMSCSDKIVRWGALGMQGALLSRYVPDPIAVESVVVGRDPRYSPPRRGEEEEEENEEKGGGSSRGGGGGGDGQRAALERAISDRIARCHLALAETLPADVGAVALRQPVPAVHVAPEVFEHGKAAAEKAIVDREREPPTGGEEGPPADGGGGGGGEADRRPKSGRKRKKRSVRSPCGVSLNWQRRPAPPYVEVTVGARGVRQGKKPKRAGDVAGCASRLSRRCLAGSAVRCDGLLRRTTDARGRRESADGADAVPASRSVREDVLVEGGSVSYRAMKGSLTSKLAALRREALLGSSDGCSASGCGGGASGTRISPLEGWVVSGNAGDFVVRP